MTKKNRGGSAVMDQWVDQLIMNHQLIEISWKTIFKVFITVLIIIFLYIIRDILAILFLAIIISSVVGPASQRLVNRFQIPKILAVIFIYLFGISLFLLFLYFVIPSLINDIKLFIINMPEIMDKFSGVLQSFTGFTIKDLWEIPYNFQELLLKLADIFGRTLSGFVKTVKAFTSTTASILSVLVLSFYLSIRKGNFENILKIIFTPSQYDYILELQERVQKKLNRWLAGQLVLGLIIGILVYIGLSILGVHYALILAIIAALLELVPVAGPIIAAVPALIIALLQDPILGILTLLLYIIIQQLENHLIVPTVMRQAVGLNPVIVLLSLLIGFNLGGIIGMILAVPLVVTILEVLTDIREKKILNHRV